MTDVSAFIQDDGVNFLPHPKPARIQFMDERPAVDDLQEAVSQGVVHLVKSADDAGSNLALDEISPNDDGIRQFPRHPRNPPPLLRSTSITQPQP